MRNNTGYFERVMDPVADGAGRLRTTWGQHVPELHPSTDPGRIAARHVRLVRAALAGLEPPHDPALVSGLTELPVWNVERALARLGLPFVPAERPPKNVGGRPRKKNPMRASPVKADVMTAKSGLARQPNKGPARIGRVLSAVVAALAGSAAALSCGQIADRAHLDIKVVQQAVRNNAKSFTHAGYVQVERCDGAYFRVKTYTLSAKGLANGFANGTSKS